MPLEDFYEVAQDFLRDIGLLLRTILVIAKDESGNDMVYPFNGDTARVKRFAEQIPFLRIRRAAGDK